MSAETQIARALDLNDELASIFPVMHSANTEFIPPSSAPPILKILGPRDYAQIGSAIVQLVSIDVIDVQYARVDNNPMHELPSYLVVLLMIAFKVSVTQIPFCACKQCGVSIVNLSHQPFSTMPHSEFHVRSLS
jgi:hypothetical protein